MIKIILLKSVNKLGKFGESVMVKPGYAKNYLIPNGMALISNKNAEILLEKYKEKLTKHEGENSVKAEAIKNTISEVVLTLKKNAFDNGRIYGSISSKEVASSILEAVSEASISNISKADIEHYIKPSSVIFSQKIVNLGEYEVHINLYGAITATVKVIIESAKS